MCDCSVNRTRMRDFDLAKHFDNLGAQLDMAFSSVNKSRLFFVTMDIQLHCCINLGELASNASELAQRHRTSALNIKKMASQIVEKLKESLKEIDQTAFEDFDLAKHFDNLGAQLDMAFSSVNKSRLFFVTMDIQLHCCINVLRPSMKLRHRTSALNIKKMASQIVEKLKESLKEIDQTAFEDFDLAKHFDNLGAQLDMAFSSVNKSRLFFVTMDIQLHCCINVLRPSMKLRHRTSALNIKKMASQIVEKLKESLKEIDQTAFVDFDLAKHFDNLGAQLDMAFSSVNKSRLFFVTMDIQLHCCINVLRPSMKLRHRTSALNIKKMASQIVEKLKESLKEIDQTAFEDFDLAKHFDNLGAQLDMAFSSVNKSRLFFVTMDIQLHCCINVLRPSMKLRHRTSALNIKKMASQIVEKLKESLKEIDQTAFEDFDLAKHFDNLGAQLDMAFSSVNKSRLFFVTMDIQLHCCINVLRPSMKLRHRTSALNIKKMASQIVEKLKESLKEIDQTAFVDFDLAKHFDNLGAQLDMAFSSVNKSRLFFVTMDIQLHCCINVLRPSMKLRHRTSALNIKKMASQIVEKLKESLKEIDQTAFEDFDLAKHFDNLGAQLDMAFSSVNKSRLFFVTMDIQLHCCINVLRPSMKLRHRTSALNIKKMASQIVEKLKESLKEIDQTAFEDFDLAKHFDNLGAQLDMAFSSVNKSRLFFVTMDIQLHCCINVLRPSMKLRHRTSALNIKKMASQIVEKLKESLKEIDQTAFEDFDLAKHFDNLGAQLDMAFSSVNKSRLFFVTMDIQLHCCINVLRPSMKLRHRTSALNIKKMASQIVEKLKESLKEIDQTAFEDFDLAKHFDNLGAQLDMAFSSVNKSRLFFVTMDIQLHCCINVLRPSMKLRHRTSALNIKKMASQIVEKLKESLKEIDQTAFEDFDLAKHFDNLGAQLDMAFSSVNKSRLFFVTMDIQLHCCINVLRPSMKLRHRTSALNIKKMASQIVEKLKESLKEIDQTAFEGEADVIVAKITRNWLARGSKESRVWLFLVAT
ncbi:hypothetical protein GPALN_014783 [Globodera pallida]|nr:hypothetical protein GPALN_014783 [Globodera pallida]